MKDWRQVDQLDYAENPETMENIQSKFGEYKMKIVRRSDSDYIYFNCQKNNCKFQMRWEKSGGAVHCRQCVNCEHNHPIQEISNGQPFQNENNMEVWRQVDHLEDVEQPESLDYIREKYGTYKVNHTGVRNFVYFYCPNTKTCNFRMRWVKRNGTLEALREHHHTGPPKRLNLNKIAGTPQQLPEKSSTNVAKDVVLQTQKEENKKINQPPAVPPIANNSVPKKKNKPTNGAKKPKKGEMPKKVPFLSHEEARRIMMGFKPAKMSKEDKRGQK